MLRPVWCLLLTETLLSLPQGLATTVIRSDTKQYMLCAQLSKGGNGLVYTGVALSLSDPVTSCDGHSDRVIVKCGMPKNQAMYEGEVARMKSLESSGWAPRVHEYFIRNDEKGSPCIVMELLGTDLEKLRLRYLGKQWPLATLGSIGARMAEILESMHTKFELTHTDLHLGNFAIGKSGEPLSPILYVIDYGDTRPLVDNQRWSKSMDAILEVRQVVISIRYLWDADFKFYVEKRYNYDEDEICAKIAAALCEALKYVYSLKQGDQVDYGKVRDLMISLIPADQSYSGRILWEPLIALHGLPMSTAEKAAPESSTKKKQPKKDEPKQLAATTTKSGGISISWHAAVPILLTLASF